jgi:hypothetical protein
VYDVPVSGGAASGVSVDLSGVQSLFDTGLVRDQANYR